MRRDIINSTVALLTALIAALCYLFALSTSG